MRRHFIGLTAGLVLLATVGTAQATLINTDFETGDFSGWNVFTFDATVNGIFGVGSVGNNVVTSFDTDGDGVASNAARFQVGQTSGGRVGGGTPRVGGGIWQSFDASGLFEVSVDVAMLSTSVNADGGLFELLINGLVVDIIDFDRVTPGTLRGTLTGSTMLDAGTHELRIRMSRGYGTASSTPRQYIDDIVTNLRPVAVPAPNTLLLLMAALLVPVARRRQVRA